jgi:hypothetical protein
MSDEERQIWLNGLKIGDQVLLVRARKAPTVMIVRTVDDRHICMVDARNPRADLAHGEVVWLERGEGPYGEAIYPVDPGVLPAIGGEDHDGRVGGWEAA